ncbi:hypothetical protein SNEBB_011317 [Seison nebaliae]|nr:hypothetical protein SNEBB_011317 [Seison nebaliae]
MKILRKFFNSLTRLPIQKRLVKIIGILFLFVYVGIEIVDNKYFRNSPIFSALIDGPNNISCIHFQKTHKTGGTTLLSILARLSLNYEYRLFINRIDMNQMNNLQSIRTNFRSLLSRMKKNFSKFKRRHYSPQFGNLCGNRKKCLNDVKYLEKQIQLCNELIERSVSFFTKRQIRFLEFNKSSVQIFSNHLRLPTNGMDDVHNEMTKKLHCSGISSITMIREPISATISMYNFNQRVISGMKISKFSQILNKVRSIDYKKSNKYAVWKSSNNKALNIYLRNNFLTFAADRKYYSSIYFAHEPDGKKFRQLLNKLLHDYNFIGMVEQYDKSLLMTGDKLNLDIMDLTYIAHNQRRKSFKYDTNLTPADNMLLKDWISADIETYKMVKERFIEMEMDYPNKRIIIELRDNRTIHYENRLDYFKKLNKFILNICNIRYILDKKRRMMQILTNSFYSTAYDWISCGTRY